MKPQTEIGRNALDEFKAAYEAEFGETLTDEQAKEIALRLLQFFGILSDPRSA